MPAFPGFSWKAHVRILEFFLWFSLYFWLIKGNFNIDYYGFFYCCFSLSLYFLSLTHTHIEEIEKLYQYWSKNQFSIWRNNWLIFMIWFDHVEDKKMNFIQLYFGSGWFLYDNELFVGRPEIISNIYYRIIIPRDHKCST